MCSRYILSIFTPVIRTVHLCDLDQKCMLMTGEQGLKDSVVLSQ